MEIECKGWRSGVLGRRSCLQTFIIVGLDFGSERRHAKASVSTRTTLLETFAIISPLSGAERRESNTSFNMTDLHDEDGDGDGDDTKEIISGGCLPMIVSRTTTPKL